MKNRLGAIQTKIALVMLSVMLLLLTPLHVFAAEADEDSMRQTAAVILSNCMNTTDEMYKNLDSLREVELDYALLNSGIPCEGKNYLKILSSWNDGLTECGAYADSEDIQTLISTYVFKEINGDIELSGEMKFAGRNANVTFSFEKDGTITSLTVGGHYSAGEILKKAALNTVIGMGIVFLVLAFLAWIMSCFKYIGIWQQNRAKKAQAPASSAPAAPVQGSAADAPAIVVEGDIDEEIVAVIAAAVSYELELNPLRNNE